MAFVCSSIRSDVRSGMRSCLFGLTARRDMRSDTLPPEPLCSTGQRLGACQTAVRQQPEEPEKAKGGRGRGRKEEEEAKEGRQTIKSRDRHLTVGGKNTFDAATDRCNGDTELLPALAEPLCRNGPQCFLVPLIAGVIATECCNASVSG